MNLIEIYYLPPTFIDVTNLSPENATEGSVYHSAVGEFPWEHRTAESSVGEFRSRLARITGVDLEVIPDTTEDALAETLTLARLPRETHLRLKYWQSQVSTAELLPIAEIAMAVRSKIKTSSITYGKMTKYYIAVDKPREFYQLLESELVRSGCLELKDVAVRSIRDESVWFKAYLKASDSRFFVSMLIADARRDPYIHFEFQKLDVIEYTPIDFSRIPVSEKRALLGYDSPKNCRDLEVLASTRR